MNSWKEFFALEKEKEYYKKLHDFVEKEYATKNIYPPYPLILNAFKLTPLNETKVVLIGQDPYYRKGQAMGLSFSVPKNIEVPPSLVNIFKEIANEYHAHIVQDGDLTYLAKQGVLLLNASLTVEEGKPMSHAHVGYEELLSNVLRVLNEHPTPKVFLLWGGYARGLKKMISNPIHLILESPHPSPLSAYQGFFGNNHFIKTNEFLKANHMEEICWIKKDYEEKMKK